MLIRKIGLRGNSYIIGIPKHFVSTLDLKLGDRLSFKYDAKKNQLIFTILER